MKNCPDCHYEYAATGLECPECGWPRTATESYATLNVSPDAKPETVEALVRAMNALDGCIFGDEPIHNWFGLSYAQYLTIPRSVLQSMPIEWQERFVECLIGLDQMVDWRPKEGAYHVTLCELAEVWDEELQCYTEEWGHEIHDPLQDYERGRRRITLFRWSEP